MNVNYKEKAQKNLEGFVRVLHELKRKEGIHFDVMVSGGDSGLAMQKIASMLFKEFKKPTPIQLKLPVYRFKEKAMPEGERFDNSCLVSVVEKELRKVNEAQNILFIDDEIRQGRTLGSVLRLMHTTRGDLFETTPSVYVVAEDHGFKKHMFAEETPPGFVKIFFKPFAKREGINNAISYLVPGKLLYEIKQAYGDRYSSKEIFNAVLGLPTKKLKNGCPVWSNKLEKDFKNNIPNFIVFQKEVKKNIEKTIKNILSK